MEQINEQFGKPFLERVSTISKALEESTELSNSLEVMGEYRHLKQIKVRIELPVYRINNGRTRTLQKEYIAKNGLPDDFFSKDENSSEVQQCQHIILRQLANEESLYKEFQNCAKKQTEPLIVTPSGVVVNGNRRLCTWRELYYNDRIKYSHFSYINVAVLPPECDETEIKLIEKRLQIQKSLKAEYTWHSKAMMMRDEFEAHVSYKDIANSYGINEKEVRIQLEALGYAEEYLESIGKKDRWSLVNTLEYAFKELAKQKDTLRDQGKKEFFKELCFAQFKEGNQTDRFYLIVKDTSKFLDNIFIELSKERSPIVDTQDKESEDDLSFFDNDTNETNAYSVLAQSIHNTPINNLGSRLQDVFDEQKAEEKEKNDSLYLLNNLSKASKILANVSSTFNEPNNYQLEGVLSQLETIQRLTNDLIQLTKNKQNTKL